MEYKDPMSTTVIHSLQQAMKGKKLIRMSHTLEQGIEQTIVPIPQEVWYKYPTLDEDIIRPHVSCKRAFPNRDRDREYTYDMVIWKMRSDAYMSELNAEPLFFSFMNSTNLAEACIEYGYRELMPDYKLFKDIQDKNRLEEFGVDVAHGQIPFLSGKIENLSYRDISHELGHKFVIQYSVNRDGYNSSGGRDTFIIENSTDFRNVQERAYGIPAKISQFIYGTELGVNAIATANGTVVCHPYVQAIGIPELTKNESMFCGIDFSMGKTLSPDICNQVRKITKYVGERMYAKGYKGIFGIDFLCQSDSNNVFVLEVNPRLTGATNMLTFLSHSKGIVPMIAIHLSTHLDCLPEIFSIESYEEQLQELTVGSMLYIRNREGRTVQALSGPKPGAYTLQSGNLHYAQEAYSCDQLTGSNQFLLRQIHTLRRNIGPVERLCAIQSLQGCLVDSHKLTDEFKDIAEEIYTQFEFSRENFYDSAVPYRSAQ
jgi:hypothetical protein